MKRIYALLILSLAGYFTYAQSVGDFRSKQSNSWNNSNTWERWNGSNWQSSSAPNISDGVITISHTVTIPTGQTIAQDNIIIALGGQLLNSGTLNMSAGTPSFEIDVTGQLVNTGTISFSSGSLMQLNSGSSYIHNSTQLASQISSNCVMNSASNFIFRSTTTVFTPDATLSNTAYGNIAFENVTGSSWSPAMTGSISYSCNNFTIGSNISIINNNTGMTTISGNFSVNGTLSNGTGSQRFTFTGLSKTIFYPGVAFFDSLVISSPADISITSNMLVPPNGVVHVFGRLNIKIFSITGDGTTSIFKAFTNSILASEVGGVSSMVYNFGTITAEDQVSYEEFSQVNTPLLWFWNNNIKNLTIATASNLTTTFFSTSTIFIYGTLTLTSGYFNIQNSSLLLFGPPIAGTATNLLSNQYGIIQIHGTSSGHFIPSSITQCGYIYLNNPNGLTINGNLEITQRLDLGLGILNCGPHTVTVSDTIDTRFTGATSTSYVNGTLCFRTKVGTDSLFFPVGSATAYMPLSFNNVTASASTFLKATAFSSLPTGTGDNSTIFSLSDRYWKIGTVGTNSITSSGKVTLRPTGVNPALGASSKVAISTTNTATSYTSLGGTVSSPNITSVNNFSASQLADLNTPDGTFLSVGTNSQPGGVYCIGPSPSYTPPAGVTYQNGNSPFPTITAAVATLNANAFTGTVIFELQNNYVSTSEVFPINITFQGTVSLTATFRPRSDAGSNIIISGALATINTEALIQLNGADYVTFDGSPGGTNGSTVLLLVRTLSDYTGTFLLKNDARNNTINAIRCESAYASNNITIGGTTGSAGNDFTTITNCEFIQVTGGGLPENMIFSAAGTTGSAANNSITLTGNKIANSTNGVNFSSGCSGTISITNNHFYRTVNFLSGTTWNAVVFGGTETAVVTVSNNFVGGSEQNAGGTPMLISSAGAIDGFQINNAATGSSNVISGNTFQNITISNMLNVNGFEPIYIIGPATISNNIIGGVAANSILYTNTGLADFVAITLTNSNTNASSITGNIIQNISSQILPGASGIFKGIYYFNTIATHTITVSNNTIRNINLAHATQLAPVEVRGSNTASANTIIQNNKVEAISAPAAANFMGFFVSSRPCTFTGNRMGKYNTQNDIMLGVSVSTLGYFITGTAGLLTAEDDTLANITLTGTGAYNMVCLYFDNAGAFAHSIQRNVIYTIKSASTLSSTETADISNTAITGLYLSTQGNNLQLIRNNIINGLISTTTSASANPVITGMEIGTIGTVSNNSIYNLSTTAANTTTLPTLIGIRNTGPGNTTSNNMIAINNGGLTNRTNIYGIYDSHSTSTNNYYHNSISITGSAIGSTARTSAFWRNGSAGTLNIRNNIFNNDRSGGGKNYAIGNQSGTSAAWSSGGTVNFNTLYTVDPATTGAWPAGTDKTIAAWRTASANDNNSLTVPAVFVNAVSDLHLTSTSNCPLKGAGTTGTGVTTDFDNQARGSSPTIGADEITFACNITVNLRVLIQGYYTGTKMKPVLYLQNASADSNHCDTIRVEVRNSVSPYAINSSFTLILNTDGTTSFTLPEAQLNQTYYLALKHRNALETWSTAMTVNSRLFSYDFTTAVTKAFGSKQIQLAAGIFGLYSGDVSTASTAGIQDGIININDLNAVQNNCFSFARNYIPYDLTGDLLTESADFSMIENNFLNGAISVSRP